MNDWEQEFYDHFFFKQCFASMEGFKEVKAWIKKHIDNSQDWKSVQAPPEKAGEYIVYDENKFGTNKVDLYRYEPFNDSWFWGADAFHPSYWMPLPQNPKEQEQPVVLTKSNIALKQVDNSSDAVDFMNWTLGGDCLYECTDEDQWIHEDNKDTPKELGDIHLTTKEVYDIWVKHFKNKK